jgi:hypothetical protein
VVLALALMAGCTTQPDFNRREAKFKLVSAMQLDLLRSVEAEKIAVIASSDEESHEHANASRKAAADVEAERRDLRALLESDGRPSELAKLEVFEAAWTRLRAIDARLLELAVSNSNLKATRLLAGASATDVNELVDALTELEAATAEPKALRELSAASVAALRIQTLLQRHIASASDQEMSALEQQLRSLSTPVDQALADPRPKAPAGVQQGAARARAAWARFQHDVAEVLRLSRQNTNLASFDLSVHEKRVATVEALNSLAALLTEVKSEAQPTR